MAECTCGKENVTLVYSCSGAANTGLLADKVMRALNRDNVGSSTCLAALGADLSGFVQSAANACRNIVIDGCKVSCGAKIFMKNGLPYSHYIMTDFGVEKGKTEITDDLAEKIRTHVEHSLKDPSAEHPS